MAAFLTLDRCTIGGLFHASPRPLPDVNYGPSFQHSGLMKCNLQLGVHILKWRHRNESYIAVRGVYNRGLFSDEGSASS